MKNARSAKWEAETPRPDTPYQRAEQVWDDRIGNSRKQAANWRIAAFFSMSVSLVSVCGMIYLGQLPKTEVEVVQVDKLGNATYTGQAGQSMADWRPTEKQIEFHLRRYIHLTRSLSSDMMVVRQNWIDAYHYIADEATNKLSLEARSLSPFERMKTQRVSLSIEDLLRLSPDTWQVDWREQIWSTKGDMLGQEQWRGTFKIEMVVPANKEQLQKNPLGMYITHYAWSKVFR